VWLTAWLWGAVVGLCLLLGLATASAVQAVDELARFERPDVGIGFSYPREWKLTTDGGRGLLSNQVLAAAAVDKATGFGVGLYQLGAVVTADTLDSTLEQQDRAFRAWLGAQPGGRLVQVYDVLVDGADGREYIFEQAGEAEPLRSDLLLVLNGDKALEISRWAPAGEYDQVLGQLDVIFDSLKLPWARPG
jgi:hypothetical protein